MWRLVLLSMLLVRILALFIKFTPTSIIENSNFDNVTMVFSVFDINFENLSTVASLLTYDRYNFGRHFYQQEPEDRIEQLKSFMGEKIFHGTIFFVHKLLFSSSIAADFFLSSSNQNYSGNLLVKRFRSGKLLYRLNFEDPILNRKVIQYAIENNMGQMESIQWLKDFLRENSMADIEWLFDLLSPLEMTPEILKKFLVLPSGVPSFIPTFLDPSLPTNDLLVRVAIAVFTVCTNKAGLYDNKKIVKHIKQLDFFEGLNLNAFPNVTPNSFLQALLPLAKTRTDRSFWTILFNMALIGKNYDYLQQTLLYEIPKYLSPYNSRKLLRRLGKVIKGKLSFLLPRSFSPIYYPNALQPLSFRLRNWFHHGPLGLTVETPELITMCTQTSNVRLSLNGRLEEPIKDYRGIYVEKYSDVVIHYATEILKSGIPRDFKKMAIVVASWPYLLATNRKLDLGLFFSGDQASGDWKVTLSGISQNCNSKFILDQSLERYSIKKFFKPAELACLIDESSSIKNCQGLFLSETRKIKSDSVNFSLG